MLEKEILELKKDVANNHTAGGLVRAAVRKLGAEDRISSRDNDDSIPAGTEAAVGGIVAEVEAYEKDPEPWRTPEATGESTGGQNALARNGKTAAAGSAKPRKRTKQVRR